MHPILNEKYINKKIEDFYTDSNGVTDTELGQLFNKVKYSSRNINPTIDMGLFRSTLSVNSSDEIPYENVTEERVFSARTFNKPAMVVLPHRPKEGFNIFVSDEHGSWKFYPLIVHRNGNKIMGLEENLKCDVPNAVFGLKYINSAMGWVIHQDLSLKIK